VNAAKGGPRRCCSGAEAQAKQAGECCQGRGCPGGRAELARLIEFRARQAPSLRLLLARDWITMGEELSNAKGGSVLMVDPHEPARCSAALRDCSKGEAGSTSPPASKQLQPATPLSAPRR